MIECQLRRLHCPGCGDLPEAVEWARGGARYTREFDDLVAWLAQQISQTQVTKLMPIGWETVGNILERVVADKLDQGRLDGLRFIGLDEVSYGAEHKFLTCVADHEKPRIVWAAPGRNAASLQAFFDGLTSEQKASIKAVSIDMSAGYEKAIRAPRGSRTPRSVSIPSSATRRTCSCGVRDPVVGLSRQPGEAEGSLIPELWVRMASGPDNDAARWDYRTARARQARPKGVIPVHQCQNPLEPSSTLKGVLPLVHLRYEGTTPPRLNTQSWRRPVATRGD